MTSWLVFKIINDNGYALYRFIGRHLCETANEAALAMARGRDQGELNLMVVPEDTAQYPMLVSEVNWKVVA